MNVIPKQRFVQKYHLKAFGGLLLFILLIWWSARVTEVDFGLFFVNFDQFLALLQKMSHPDWQYLSLVIAPLVETIKMALIGTSIGTLLAIPFSVLAARNVINNDFARGLIRLILNLVRTLPDLMLAALFVAIVGIGSLAGVLTLAVFSFGMIAKLFYEAIETIDDGPLEALQAAGATKMQMIHFAVLPQVFNHFISYFLYTFEINVRASTVLGYLGAGGIGVYLQRSLSQFAYDQTAVIILGILAVVLVIDGISNTLRERLL